MTRGPHRAGLACVAILLAVGHAADAQAQGWTLDAYVGRAVHDPVATQVGAGHAVLGIRYGDLRAAWLYLSTAAPLAAGDPAWAAAGAGRRWTVTGGRRLAFGIDVAAHVHGYRDAILDGIGGGATLEALPRLDLAAGPAGIELSSGWVQYLAATRDGSEGRGAHRTAIRLAARPAAALELAADGRYVRTEGEGFPFAGASAEASFGRGEAWGYVGRWLSDALPGTAWGIGSSLDLGERITVWASLHDETSDPLYWNTPRRGWSLGISRRLGARAAPHAAAPVATDAGRVTIQVPVAAAPAPLFVAGDFNGWQPIPMTRIGEGWILSLKLPPGAYRYAFRTGNGEWFVPESAPGRTSDGMGGYSAVLLVP